MATIKELLEKIKANQANNADLKLFDKLGKNNETQTDIMDETASDIEARQKQRMTDSALTTGSNAIDPEKLSTIMSMLKAKKEVETPSSDDLLSDAPIVKKPISLPVTTEQPEDKKSVVLDWLKTHGRDLAAMVPTALAPNDYKVGWLQEQDAQKQAIEEQRQAAIEAKRVKEEERIQAQKNKDEELAIKKAQAEKEKPTLEYEVAIKKAQAEEVEPKFATNAQDMLLLDYPFLNPENVRAMSKRDIEKYRGDLSAAESRRQQASQFDDSQAAAQKRWEAENGKRAIELQKSREELEKLRNENKAIDPKADVNAKIATFNSTDKKDMGNIKMGLRGLYLMREGIKKGDSVLSVSDNEFTYGKKIFVEGFARPQTGAAIGGMENINFGSFVPGLRDFTKAMKDFKLDEMERIFYNKLKSYGLSDQQYGQLVNEVTRRKETEFRNPKTGRIVLAQTPDDVIKAVEMGFQAVE